MQSSPHSAFTRLYVLLRAKEDRLYADEQVRLLPGIAREHPHYREWRCRGRSAARLVNHFSRLQRPLHILEAGCGNGWLSHRLSAIPRASVTGFDINAEELAQAARVFGNIPHLRFVGGNPLEEQPQRLYDAIVFAASIQYFASLENTMRMAMRHLKTTGSIHITDTHFYKPHEIMAAKQRSASHFRSLGFPGMNDHYFHHTIQSLQPFNYRLLYDPSALWNRLRKASDPFPWICIQNEA